MPDSEPVSPSVDLAVEPRRRAPPPALAPDYLEGEFHELPPRRLHDYVRVLSKHRRLAAGCFAGCLVVTLLVTLLTPSAYTASAQIQVARSSPIKLQLKDNVLDLDETERILNGVSSFLSTQVEALRSRDVAERAIRVFHLAENPAFVEHARGDAALAAVGVPLPAFLQPRGMPDAPTAETMPPPADGPVDPLLLDRYLGYLTVEDVRGTDLIEVRFTAPDAALAALLTAAHIQAYLDLVKESQITTDATAKAFLAQQLEESRTRVERAEAALAEFAAAHPEVAVNQEDQLVGKQVKLMSLQVNDAEGRRAAAQSRFEFLSKAKHEPLQHFLDDTQAIPKLRLALLDLQAQEAALQPRLGPNHSQMRDLRRQETEIQLQLDAEVQQEIGAARARFKAAKLQEDELRSHLAALEKSATTLRSLGGQYDYLKGELENSRALHDSLLKQKTETSVHSELAASNIRVIERPEVPRYASWPRKRLNLLIGAFAGIGLALGAAFFRESLDNSVKSSEEAEGLLRLPTLAIIPNFVPPRPLGAQLRATWRERDSLRGLVAAMRRGAARRNGSVAPEDARRHLVVMHRPSSPVAETFRMLRTTVLFASTAAPPQVVLVTSAASGEGKTVTSLNLASTLADAGQRVLLIDVDLRHPVCHAVLGAPLAPGLSNHLSGAVEVDRAVREIASPHIAFLPAGPPPANPAELIGSERMREALARLRRHFDFIVLDSPPVLPLTDAVLLARVADAVVLVVNGKKSPREFVRRARDQLVQVGANVLGVVINDAGPDWGHAYLYSDDRYRRAPVAATEGPTA